MAANQTAATSTRLTTGPPPAPRTSTYTEILTSSATRRQCLLVVFGRENPQGQPLAHHRSSTRTAGLVALQAAPRVTDEELLPRLVRTPDRSRGPSLIWIKAEGCASNHLAFGPIPHTETARGGEHARRRAQTEKSGVSPGGQGRPQFHRRRIRRGQERQDLRQALAGRRRADRPRFRSRRSGGRRRGRGRARGARRPVGQDDHGRARRAALRARQRHQRALRRFPRTPRSPTPASRCRSPAIIDIPRGAANFKVFADIIKNVATEFFEMATPDGAGAINYAMRRPMGVVGVICPWNLPLLLMTWKVAPALACGNTVVVKPSEESPQTAALLGEVMNAVGMPQGVYNVVHGFGPGSAGEFLTTPSGGQRHHLHRRDPHRRGHHEGRRRRRAPGVARDGRQEPGDRLRRLRSRGRARRHHALVLRQLRPGVPRHRARLCRAPAVRQVRRRARRRAPRSSSSAGRTTAPPPWAR